MNGLAAPLVKGIVFVLITGLATMLLAITIANVRVHDTEEYSARFADATSLREGDDVRVAGVRVGQVSGITLAEDNVAEVKFSVARARTVSRATIAKIKYRNLVGQRYIALERGPATIEGSLIPGQTIPLERTVPALDLTALFNGFKPLFQALSPEDVNKLSYEIIQVFQGEGGTVRSLLAHVSSLTGTLADKDAVIGEVIDNLNGVLDAVNARENQLSTLVTNSQLLVSGLARDRDTIGSAIGALGELTTSTAGLLEQGRPPLKNDISALGGLSRNLADNTPVFQQFLDRLPTKYETIGRTASYGSWFNFYLCSATADGAPPPPNGPPDIGFPVTESRCSR